MTIPEDNEALVAGHEGGGQAGHHGDHVGGQGHGDPQQ